MIMGRKVAITFLFLTALLPNKNFAAMGANFWPVPKDIAAEAREKKCVRESAPENMQIGDLVPPYAVVDTPDSEGKRTYQPLPRCAVIWIKLIDYYQEQQNEPCAGLIERLSRIKKSVTEAYYRTKTLLSAGAYSVFLLRDQSPTEPINNAQDEIGKIFTYNLNPLPPLREDVDPVTGHAGLAPHRLAALITFEIPDELKDVVPKNVSNRGAWLFEHIVTPIAYSSDVTLAMSNPTTEAGHVLLHPFHTYDNYRRSIETLQAENTSPLFKAIRNDPFVSHIRKSIIDVYQTTSARPREDLNDSGKIAFFLLQFVFWQALSSVKTLDLFLVNEAVNQYFFRQQYEMDRLQYPYASDRRIFWKVQTEIAIVSVALVALPGLWSGENKLSALFLRLFRRGAEIPEISTPSTPGTPMEVEP